MSNIKIYLFLNDKILHFLLPKEPLESFSFDEDEDEESKLINIEAIEDKWYIYSTAEVSILVNNSTVDKLLLESCKFYVLRRNNKIYLIYVSSIDGSLVSLYDYDTSINLTIGKSQNCSIVYNYDAMPEVAASIHYVENKLTLEVNGTLVYVNNLFVNSNRYIINIGDQINIYSLKIIILSNKVVVISDKRANINNISSSKLLKHAINQEKNIDYDVKDEDLYTKADYYSKSPRLRRFIETKTIKLSKPPVGNLDEDLPAILTIGPIFTMGIISAVTLSQSLSNLISHKTEISSEWPRLLTASAMLISMVLWPALTKYYNKKRKKKKRKELEEKYGNYLEERKQELVKEAKYQNDVLLENLLSTAQCLNIISKQGYNFWDKRSDQDDFLQVRVGLGRELLNVDINYSEQDFTVDEDVLKKQADKLVEDFKYIYNVPVKYSFCENKVTAILGNTYKCHMFMNNLIIQLITYYTYEDLKFVVFTNKSNEKNWDYLKYLNHNFSNSKDIRFFASDVESAKNVSNSLSYIVNQRLKAESDKNIFNPYFIIIIDDYNAIKNFDFIKKITESEFDLGISIILLEDRLSELPSKCNNFISIGINTKCEIIRNTYEKQERLEFTEEIIYNLDMMQVVRKLSNIPIEFESGNRGLPNTISFLEMEKVGKVEQLNILNRWNTNDSTISLKSEVGIDELGNLIYLDLHEKFHGPHGLIAGTTGSGKSEFIITYILSMCINFSPDIVSFVLIDYKGGGLALAFENKNAGIFLPHLAGTITNLDKSEMDRTLVSIDSEVKRRQKIFNEAREVLGESTIDIYKYQKYYKEGKLKEPVTHLFIICDEFAELKSQHPEFMDNLISVARIGRSLGVHLVLATQKPSGVVNDQIWSNSRFKVCLKVQDEADSKEMLKKPDAAYLKQTGRFYLQVGFDEYYVLGQSGWCGAKYYPSDKIIKEVDKSINFINDSGNFIKSIKAASNNKIEASGEQFNSILNAIINISKKTGKKSKRLWLDNIDPIILVDSIKAKYNIAITPNKVEAILGEYDAPEIQEQGVVKYNYLEDGNTIIYGNNGVENEMLLQTLIYSTCKYHSSSEVNFYIMDYGSESLRKFESLPHLGGMVFASDEEKYNNLVKLIRNEIKRRKRILSSYGGEYKNYIQSNTLPLIVVILNNYDSISDSNANFFEIIPDLVRDSERYGIIFIITCNSISSVSSKVSSNFNNAYAFKLRDQSDYMVAFNSRPNTSLRDTLGRGFIKDTVLHEFQTASIVSDQSQLSDFISNFLESQKSLNQPKAIPIPILPEVVKFDDIKSEVSTINNVPIGISKEELEIITIDYLSDIGNIISSNRLNNTEIFIKSLVMLFKKINKLELFVIDPLGKLNYNKNYVNNYFTQDMDQVVESFNQYIQSLISKNYDVNGVIIIYGIDKFISKLSNSINFEKLLKHLKEYEKISVIIVDDAPKIKGYVFEAWFKSVFNINNGLWIGKGISDQNLFHLNTINKAMTKEIKNNMGYVVNESLVTLCKLIDFINDQSE